jgi:membrane fusion protein (multidrug efflux system)
VLLRAVFPNKGRTLLPGMFVRATLGVGSNSQALLVPQAGVSRNARGEATVLVVDADSKVSERIIEVDRAVGSDWVVSSGLVAGERVIVEGVQKVRPGSTVTAKPAGALSPVAGSGK